MNSVCLVCYLSNKVLKLIKFHAESKNKSEVGNIGASSGIGNKLDGAKITGQLDIDE